MSENKTCFIICPIGPPDSEMRKDSDCLLNFIISPPVLKFNYSIERADSLDKPGSITQQIINKLIHADLVIADLTHHNPNVFYELAIRHATQKPYIQMIRNGHIIPFDVGDLRTIYYDFPIDLANRAINNLEKQIHEINSDGFVIYSPISFSLNIGPISDSHNYNEIYFQEINSKLNKMIQFLDDLNITQYKSNDNKFLKDRDFLSTQLNKWKEERVNISCMIAEISDKLNYIDSNKTDSNLYDSMELIKKRESLIAHKNIIEERICDIERQLP